jgi:hypothetical protein
MSKITINGQRVEIPPLPVMTDQQLQCALIAAALGGDLYTCAICEIAMHGFPRTRTWEQLIMPLKQQLHREYLNADGVSWQRERAQLVMLRRAGAA